MTINEQLTREELDRTQRLNAQLAFENYRLREALKPLSAWAEQYDERVYPPDSDAVKIRVPLGELRGARSALNEAKP
jgi:hypothetical protein